MHKDHWNLFDFVLLKACYCLYHADAFDSYWIGLNIHWIFHIVLYTQNVSIAENSLKLLGLTNELSLAER